MPSESRSYIRFNEDGTFNQDDNQSGSYEIKSNSIIKRSPTYIAKGRLLEQNNEVIHILWGNVEAIKYYRADHKH